MYNYFFGFGSLDQDYIPLYPIEQYEDLKVSLNDKDNIEDLVSVIYFSYGEQPYINVETLKAGFYRYDAIVLSVEELDKWAETLIVNDFSKLVDIPRFKYHPKRKRRELGDAIIPSGGYFRKVRNKPVQELSHNELVDQMEYEYEVKIKHRKRSLVKELVEYNLSEVPAPYDKSWKRTKKSRQWM